MNIPNLMIQCCHLRRLGLMLGLMLGLVLVSQVSLAQTPPGVPRAFSPSTLVVNSQIQITVRWLAPLTGVTRGFRIERKLSADTAFLQVGSDINGSTLIFIDDSVNAGMEYDYRIFAINTTTTPELISPALNAGRIRTLSDSNIVPANFLVVAATNTADAPMLHTTEVNLTWEQPAADGVLIFVREFVIQRRIGASGAYTEIARPLSGVRAYTDTGLMPSTVYHYRISLETSGANVWTSRFNIATFPNPPTNVEAIASSTGATDVRLTWEAPIVTGTITGYRIFRQISGNANIVTLETNTHNTDILYIDRGAPANTSYIYQVATIEAAGASVPAAAAVFAVGSAMAVDVNADGTADSDDALAIYYVTELGSSLADSDSLQTTLLQSLRAELTIAELLSNIESWLASAAADLNADGTADSMDALALYYVAELGPTLGESASLQATLLRGIRGGTFVVSRLFDRAQAVLDAANGN